LLALVPVVVGVEIAVRRYGVIDWAEDMPRIVVPGTGEILLGFGRLCRSRGWRSSGRTSSRAEPESADVRRYNTYLWKTCPCSM
jgi:hypothetical protein